MRRTVSATDAVQAPLALASALAVITWRWPRSITASRQMSSRSARTQRAPVRMSAPRSAASTRIGDHQPRIVHHAVGIFERGAERPLQRIADRMVGDIDRRRGRQTAARGQPVIEQQPRPQQPGRTLVGMGGDREPHRPHQMRRDPQPDVALGQRRAHAQKGPALQHRKIAMDQPRRGRGCGGAEVALLQQDHPQAAPGGVARNADAVQAAADDRKIVVRHAHNVYSVFK